MKLLYIISILLVTISCNIDMDSENELPISTEPNTNSDIDTQLGMPDNIQDNHNNSDVYQRITFNQILNDPYQIDKGLYSIVLTDKLNYVRGTHLKPKVGYIEAVHINGISTDFGYIRLVIILNEYVCYKTLLTNIESDIQYIFKIKINRLEEINNRSDLHVILWSDLVSKPERR